MYIRYYQFTNDNCNMITARDSWQILTILIIIMINVNKLLITSMLCAAGPLRDISDHLPPTTDHPYVMKIQEISRPVRALWKSNGTSLFEIFAVNIFYYRRDLCTVFFFIKYLLIKINNSYTVSKEKKLKVYAIFLNIHKF